MSDRVQNRKEWKKGRANMVYLSHFQFPDIEQEYDFLMGIKRTCYDTFYPFQTISKHNLRMLDLELVTILYGGNGSGKQRY